MLSKIKQRIWRDYLAPALVKRGWRMSKSIPLDRAHLSGQFGYDDEVAIKEAILRVRDHTMTSFERLASLWQQVRYLDRAKIEGSFVECGVWKGGSVGMMALAHLRDGATPTRRLHLFDSFEGLPEPKEGVDGELAKSYSGGRVSGALTSIGQCVGPLEDSQKLLRDLLGYPTELVEYHVGWFEQTVAKDASKIGPIALLRLDGDWYESTKICLDHLYPSVVRGGVVVIDDYGHWEGCRRAVDEFVATSGAPVLLNHIDYTGRYWIKP